MTACDSFPVVCLEFCEDYFYFCKDFMRKTSVNVSSLLIKETINHRTVRNPKLKRGIRSIMKTNVIKVTTVM